MAGRWTAAVVMLVAALKGRAIVLYYMELKDAQLAWRLVFKAWLAIATVVIVAFWALSAGNS
ncbi:cytochrome C oxidase subunit IV family protein [Aromatoleum toluclasticum]|uniref:cytochrome C oxidase subunit IV family protein n=1 Tax=Aromatoleum toluclasticum TaxID=92003 RepID=UPI0012F823FD|nr:cytochrome C oxidase subunit IV family protein [Aromatoleum toluclasticum]